MLLTGSVAFSRPLEAYNKVQIPKIIQGQFKLKPDQISPYWNKVGLGVVTSSSMDE